MRKRLTKAARCAIISRSDENNRCEAIIILEKDFLNSPLHCFGYHSKCSVDFCTTAKQLAQCTVVSTIPSSSGSSNSSISDDGNSNSDGSDGSTSSGDDGNSIVSSDIMDTSSECYNSSNSSADTSINSEDQEDDLDNAAMESQQEWDDATDNAEVRTVPVATTTTPAKEEAIICDVQRILGRLVEKALQLLGVLLKIIYTMIYTLLHRKLYDQLN